MNEARIRDLLAANLSVIEDGLELLKIEQFIPSTLGTRNFIDILAKDKSKHWVVIEVKKTDAAAREAAHEVFKYIEAVQRHFGARNDEIRAIVAAVEWKELLIPFSRLRNETSIAVDGIQLVLNAEDNNLEARAIEPVPVNKGRYLAPWHELNMYHDKPNLDRGIASYEKSCEIKGLEDYIMVVLKAAEDFNEKASLAVELALQEICTFEGTASSVIVPELESYEYILYFAPQILTREFCLAALANDVELLEEVRDVTEDMGPEAELCTLHEYVYDLDPRPYRDYYEIGYAAKFGQKLLVEEGWTVERVLRHGMFARNSLLSDEAIIEELMGSTGSSGQSFKRTINFANKAHVASGKDDLKQALATNPAWLAQIGRVLDEASATWPNASADVVVYAPSSGVFSLYFMAIDDSMSYMPHYQIEVIDDEGMLTVLYLGLLVPKGEPASLQHILDKYYNGRIQNLMFLAGAGFYEDRDADVMDDLGLTYRTFRVNNPNSRTEWFALKDDRWRSFTPNMPWQPLQPYFDTNEQLIKSIVKAIGSRMYAGFHDLS